MGIKKIIPAIILSLLVVGGFAQQQPSGFPFKISPPLWYEMPWLKTDSGIAFASRDTTNVRPRFPFSVIGWQRPGLDSSLWFHNGGVWSRIPNANDFTNINTIDVYLVAGQSNANNSGDTTQSPKVISGTVFQYSGGNIISGNDPVGNNAAQFGSAWPAFGITYYTLTNRKICFVPAAINATSQTVAANTGAGTWDTTGTLFGNANTLVTEAMAKLKQLGYTPIFKGVLWDQGENDATAINSSTITQATYIAAFRKMIARFRGIYGPRMPFYIFRTGWITNQSQAGFTSIANAQDSVANADSLTNIVYYNAMDFNARGLMKPDFTHYLQPGYNEMGRMGAENILNSNAYKWQDQAGSIYLPYGNVGIGKSLPAYPLDIVGNQHNVGNLNIIGNITDTGTFSNVNGPFNITSSQININNSLTNPIILTNTQSGFVFNKWTNTVTGSNNGIGDAYFADGSSSSFLQLAKASTSNSLFPDGSIVRNSGTGGLWLISDNSPIKFVNGAGFTEYARFTQNGNLLFNTTTDISSSILTIQTTAKGFLPPRMTGAQMNAIVSPVVGLTVFCTDSLAICWYTGSAWVKSGSGGGGGSSGTVTLINTGAGLGGGPITTTGTITLDTGFIYSHEPVDTFYNPRAGDTTVTNPSVRKYLFKSDTAVVGAGIKINPNDSMLLFRADTSLLATQSYVLAHSGGIGTPVLGSTANNILTQDTTSLAVKYVPIDSVDRYSFRPHVIQEIDSSSTTAGAWRNDNGSPVKLGNGQWVVFFTLFPTPSTGDSDPCRIMKSFSSDLIHWSAPTVAINNSAPYTTRFIPNAYVRSNGDVYLIYGVQTSSTVAYFLISKSTDNAGTFSTVDSLKPTSLSTYAASGLDRIFKSQTGRLFFPFYYETSAAPHYAIGYYYTDSDFVSPGNWVLSSNHFSESDSTPSEAGFYGVSQSYSSPNSGEKMVLYWRTNSTVVLNAYSTDNGATFSTPYDEGIPTPASTTTIKSFNRGYYLMRLANRQINSPTIPPGSHAQSVTRKFMDVSISTDLGYTWGNYLTLEESIQNFHYFEPTLIWDSATNRIACFYSKSTDTGFTYSKFMVNVIPMSRTIKTTPFVQGNQAIAMPPELIPGDSYAGLTVYNRLLGNNSVGGSVKIGSGTTSTNKMLPAIQFTADTSSANGAYLLSRVGKDANTGNGAAGFELDTKFNNGAVSAIPLFRVQNSGTDKFFIDANGNVAIGGVNPAVSLTTNKTDAWQLPSGTTAQRPSATAARFRYNTDSACIEFNNGSIWKCTSTASSSSSVDSAIWKNDGLMNGNHTLTINGNALVYQFTTNKFITYNGALREEDIRGANLRVSDSTHAIDYFKVNGNTTTINGGAPSLIIHDTLTGSGQAQIQVTTGQVIMGGTANDYKVNIPLYTSDAANTGTNKGIFVGAFKASTTNAGAIDDVYEWVLPTSGTGKFSIYRPGGGDFGSKTYAFNVDNTGHVAMGVNTVGTTGFRLDIGGRTRHQDSLRLDSVASYFTNVHSRYTRYTLIDKSYADSVYTNIANADLTMNADHTLSAGGHQLTLGASGDKLSALVVWSSGQIDLEAGTTVKMSLPQVTSSSSADADITIAGTTGFEVLAAITANRTVTFSSQGAGKELIIWNKNASGNTWNVSGTVVDAAGSTISSLTNQTMYFFISDGTSWVKVK